MKDNLITLSACIYKNILKAMFNEITHIFSYADMYIYIFKQLKESNHMIKFLKPKSCLNFSTLNFSK